MNTWWLLVLLMGLAGLSLLAWSIRALDAAGAVAAFLMGLTVALAADLGWLVLMATFTVISVAATKVGQRRKEARRVAEARGGERGLRNVLANGLAALLMAMSAQVVGLDVAAVAFVAAVAAVTADTLASEIGALASRARLIVPPFSPTRPGENGGISWLGQAAAAAGAITIAWLGTLLVGLPPSLLWVPAAAGFVGCQMDSILGATFEQDGIHDRPLTKEDVNFLASFLPALVVLVALA